MERHVIGCEIRTYFENDCKNEILNFELLYTRFRLLESTFSGNGSMNSCLSCLDLDVGVIHDSYEEKYREGEPRIFCSECGFEATELSAGCCRHCFRFLYPIDKFTVDLNITNE